MWLAWLSTTEPTRAVVGIWRRFKAASKHGVAIAELINSTAIAGIDTTTTMFFQDVMRTGLELCALFPRLPDMPAPWLGLPLRERSDDVELEINLSETSVKAAFENLLMRDAPLRLFRDPREYRHRLDPLRATWKAEACDYMAKMRRRLRLTRRQFADLFMTSLRTVERWETHTRRPSTRHQWQLRLLAQYAKERGLATFRRRFVGGCCSRAHTDGSQRHRPTSVGTVGVRTGQRQKPIARAG